MFDLVDGLENSLIIDGKEYVFDLSFDTVIKFYELLEDKNLKAFEKIHKAFDLFYFDNKCLPTAFSFEQKQEAIQAISDYLQQNPYGNKSAAIVSEESEPEKFYSYSQDAGAIYSSFLADYGIDLLQEKGRMHYIVFKALLAGLSEKTHFQRILSIRSKSTAGLEGEALMNLLELQEYYMLDTNKTVHQLDNQLEDMFAMLLAQAKK
jgi:hypothetical protein